MQSTNLTRQESRIARKFFVEKFFYALILKILCPKMIICSVINYIYSYLVSLMSSLESVEKISLSHSVEGGQVLKQKSYYQYL
jgi:hypothetical protein